MRSPDRSDERHTPGLVRYIVERYWPGVTLERLRSSELEAYRAVADLRASGRRIRYLGSTLIPAEECVLSVYEAESHESIAEANRRAGLTFARIVEVVELRAPEGDPVAPRTRGARRRATPEGGN